jgi:WD40 repeat protein
MAPTGRFVAVSTYERFDIRHIPEGRPVASFPYRYSEPQFSRDGSVIAAFQPGGAPPILIETSTWTTRQLNESPDSSTRCLALAPGNDFLAVGGGYQQKSAHFERFVKVYEVASGNIIRTYPERARTVIALAYSSDGSKIIGATSNELFALDANSSATIWSIVSSCSVCAVSPDGEVAAVASGNGVQLYSASSGTPIGSRMVEGNVVTSLSFAQERGWLLVGIGPVFDSGPGGVGIWSLQDQICLGRIGQNIPTPTSVAGTPNGSRIAIGGRYHSFLGLIRLE